MKEVDITRLESLTVCILDLLGKI